MISLNDYLYSGDTVLKILHKYEADLRAYANQEKNPIDFVHADFLKQIIALLERNDFLSFQSQRVREYYKLMTLQYPFLAFSFRGRIKSLIRAEAKFNANVTELISDYYAEHGELPPLEDLKQQLSFVRDLIAYRYIISLPKCNLEPGENQEEAEIKYLYEIANQIPEFLKERGFTPVLSGTKENADSLLNPEIRPYYKDFVANPSPFGYKSLHITFYDNIGDCHTEIQLRTKAMDDYATIGPANHLGYEKRQEKERLRRNVIPVGTCKAFDEAWARQNLLQSLDLSKVEVNMFSAYSEELINDGCGFYRGRLITPFEHLSKFQNDSV